MNGEEESEESWTAVLARPLGIILAFNVLAGVVGAIALPDQPNPIFLLVKMVLAVIAGISIGNALVYGIRLLARYMIARVKARRSAAAIERTPN